MMNDVWEVVPRPQDRSVVGSRWIYKIKYVANDSIEKYNARYEQFKQIYPTVKELFPKIS